MLQYIARRLLMLLPVMIGILLVTFIIVRLIPGDPCYTMLGEKATPEKCNLFKERYGLNDSIPVQFLRYVQNLAQGDLGESIRDRRPIADVVAERLPMTIELTIMAMIFASVVGVLMGVMAALKRNSFADLFTMLVANVGVSMPVFWLGLLLAYVFALVLKGTPFYLPPSSRLSAGLSIVPLADYWGIQNATGMGKFLLDLISNSAILNGLLRGDMQLVLDALRHLILPSFAVGTISLAVIARMTRSSLLEVLGQDYVRTARAKGLTQRVVITKHALRNALIPIVTIIGIQTGQLLSGAVLTETIFSLPGVGSRMVEAILSRDYPVVQGFAVVVALIFVFTNLIVDISYAYLDPRIRLD
ncbi:MAG TPA: ABC transporter permease [Anaerolineaceae bacterium]|nr:ABC transporter permease [Anaerolineaceae bacterium]HPN51574.1 ABC transporter permease [Anaerolineaceae bacterium]